MEFFEGALEVLEQLARSYQLGALTNGNADVARIGLDRYFAFAFSAADVGASKPAPDLFTHALTHAGASPANAIHVGDHPVDDVHGAGLVGMHTIWVNHTSARLAAEQTPPTAEVERLRDLPEAIAKIAGG